MNLFEVSVKLNKDYGLGITRSMFSEGYTVYAFSLVPNDLGEEYINLVRQGSVRLDVKFATNTTETLNCLAYAEFPALIEIDQSRDIKVHKSMNAPELLALTRKNRHTSDVIRGIFSSNNLPFLVSKYMYPSAYICNTDPSYLPGSHWVVFWMHSPIQAEFYDSLGNPPV